MSTAAPIAAHAGIRHYTLLNNQLMLAGLSMREIAEKAGQTPFYVYDSALMRARVAELRTRLPTNVEVHYAMKANPMAEVVRLFAGVCEGIDLASVGEMQVALAQGIPAQRLSFAGPGKTAAAINAAVAAGVTLNAESLREIHLAIHAGQTQQKTAHIAIRINPDFELKGSGMKMGGGAKPFGLDVALVPKALALIKHSHARFIGFHCYSGSQNLKADSLIETQAKSIALCEQLCDDAQMSAELFNIGGGFGIPYFPGEQALDYARVCHELSREAHALAQRRPQTKLALELGRYLVGEAGLYVCEVIERKMSHGQVFLITNGGLHHHLSASGNFGQVLRKNYPLCLAHQVCADELETVQVVGPLCTPLDLLGNAVKLPRADEHDLIAIFQSGAYGYTASPHLFLNHPKPVEILL